MVEENGRIKLTWQQITWGISTIILLSLGWADIRGRINTLSIAIGGIYTKSDIDILKRDADNVHNGLRKDVDRIKKRLRIED
jgi:hypothetical protein